MKLRLVTHVEVVVRACEQCQEAPRVQGERYCPKCKRAVLSRLHASTQWRAFYAPPVMMKPRAPDMREEQQNTPNPWQENAVRELEDCRED